MTRLTILIPTDMRDILTSDVHVCFCFAFLVTKSRETKKPEVARSSSTCARALGATCDRFWYLDETSQIYGAFQH